jgi:hypothetical protein
LTDYTDGTNPVPFPLALVDIFSSRSEVVDQGVNGKGIKEANVGY